MTQGGLPTRFDHEWAVSSSVAENRAFGTSQVLRLCAGLRGPALGEARPEYLPRSLQAAQC